MDSQSSGAIVTTTYAVRGLSCASCVAKTEKALTAVPGVVGVTVNLPGGTVSVESHPGIVAFQDLRRALTGIGYDLGERHPDQAAARPEGESLSPWLAGVAGALGLYLVFFGFVTLTDSLTHAWEQFGRVWFPVSLLAVGFGTQLGLFIHVRDALRRRAAGGATAGVAASGGVSTVSMIACCAHLLPTMLPVLGLSAAGIFLTRYQFPFMLLGILSNLVGITVMLSLIQNHGLAPRGALSSLIFRWRLSRVRNVFAVVAAMAVAVAFLTTETTASFAGAVETAGTPASGGAAPRLATVNLPARSNRQNGVEVTVAPQPFRIGDPVAFDVALDTHSGSLDVDPVAASFMEDDLGNRYLPTGWDGDPPGGHHRSGVLRFPELKPGAGVMRLILKGVGGVAERAFLWPLS